MDVQVNLTLEEIKKVLCKKCKAQVQNLLDIEEEKIKRDFEAWRMSRSKR
jgi:hypothetical protein